MEHHGFSINHVISFLAPGTDNPLGIGFFCALFLLSAVGVTLGVLSRVWSMPEAVTAVRRDYRGSDVSSEDVEGAFARLDWPGTLLLRIPALLLVVGLLGTFVGIGLAIQEAGMVIDQSAAEAGVGGAATDPDQAAHDPADLAKQSAALHSSVGNVSSVLAKLGTKFQTSCWGILASFGMGAVGSLLVSFPRQRSAYTVATACHSEWQQFEAAEATARRSEREAALASRTALDSLVLTLAPVATLAAGFAAVTSRQDTEQRLLADCHVLLKQIGETLAGDPKRGVVGIRGDLQALSSHLQTVPAAAQKMEAAGTSVALSLAKFNTDAGAALKQIGSAAGTLGTGAVAMQGAAASIGTEVRGALDKFSTSTATTLGAAAKSISESSGAVKTAIEAMKGELSGALAKLVQGTEQIGVAANSVERALGDITAVTSQMRVAITGFKESLGQLVKASDGVTQAVSKFKMMMQSFSETGDEDGASGTVLGGIRAIRDSTASLVELLADGGPSAPSLSQRITAVLESIESASGGANAHLAQLSGAIVPAGQPTAYPRLAQELSAALSGLRAASDAVAARSGAFDVLTSQIGGMAGPAGVPSLADNVGKLLAATAEIRSGLQQAYDRTDGADGLRAQLGLITQALDALTGQFDDRSHPEGRSLARQIGEMHGEATRIRRAVEQASAPNDDQTEPAARDLVEG